MKFSYNPHNTCSTRFDFDIEDDTIRSLHVENGCSGNLQGIARLLEGMNIDEAISRLKGIRCGRKDTSCPDQMALALEQFKAANN